MIMPHCHEDLNTKHQSNVLMLTRERMCLQIQVDLDPTDCSHISRWRRFSTSGESRVFSSSNESGETDRIIWSLREAPVATEPLLELKPIEGGGAQGIPVLSEKLGVELLENAIP